MVGIIAEEGPWCQFETLSFAPDRLWYYNARQFSGVSFASIWGKLFLFIQEQSGGWNTNNRNKPSQ
jgi:hypothetical protein